MNEKVIKNLQDKKNKIIVSGLQGMAYNMLKNFKDLKYADSEKNHKKQLKEIAKDMEVFAGYYKLFSK